MGESLDPTVSLSPAVTLDAYGVHTTVESLSEARDTAARILVARIRKEWRFRRSGQDYVTLRLTNNELELVRQAGGVTRPKLVNYQYLAVYQHEDSGQEVTVRSTDRPPRKRAFRTPNHGRKRFTRVRLFRIHQHPQPKESTVPKSKTKGKKKNPKASSDDSDEDELEGLEELEELEGDEPDDDEEEDEEDEEEDEKPKKRTRKKTSKKSTTKKKSKSKKPAEDDDDEDEEDEDEEEEAPKKKSKKGAKKGGKKSGKKGKGEKNNKSPGRSTKDLTGGVGTQELAAAASEIAETEITGRDVRVYLRKNEIPKNEEHGRYTWPSDANKSFVKLAKAIAAEYEDDDE